MKFTIDRSKWLRGEGDKESRLLRLKDRKMCCVGMYLNQCGATKKALLGLRDAEGLREHVGELPSGSIWLIHNHNRGNSNLAAELYAANDADNLTEEEREAEVAKYFKAAGVEVEFVN